MGAWEQLVQQAQAGSPVPCATCLYSIEHFLVNGLALSFHFVIMNKERNDEETTDVQYFYFLGFLLVLAN